MPNLCGVNQKLLAEALSSVKKGGEWPERRWQGGQGYGGRWSADVVYILTSRSMVQ
ncbi:hypothetical protein E2C01_093165 [Portunus trituberculatus]|uniref:Uncharacterized protein n=1 Tax=Portunus trituberculatus TaxID=210409 RepID=A0A5B7JM23_PORTR|nr:hypothetical protein [Portunus trituberculatus]